MSEPTTSQSNRTDRYIGDADSLTQHRLISDALLARALAALRDGAVDAHGYGLLGHHGDQAKGWDPQPFEVCQDQGCVEARAVLAELRALA